VSQVVPADAAPRAAREPERGLNDRLFDAIPLPAAWVGVLCAAVLLAALFATAALSGEWAAFEARDVSWWSIRDVRIAVVICLLAAGLPTVLRLHDQSTRRNARALAASGEIDAEPPLRGAGERWLALCAIGVLPLVALSVDRDPGVYFRPGYWTPTKAFYWLLAVVACVATGATVARVLRDARRFSRLGRGLRHVDLLDPSALSPFGRQALRSAVPGLFLLSIFAANLTDRGFVWATTLVGSLALALSGAALLLPLRGVRARVQQAKREELARVHAAIRGEPDALRGSPLERRAAPGVADLLAWRTAVAALPEWPIDAGTRLRFVALLGIPLLSWVGGALVQRVLDAALG
jgi:hypothetical protein